MADAYRMKYEPVSEEDIFDLYGCEYLLGQPIDNDSKHVLESRISEIHKIYLAAAKTRAAWVLESCGVTNVTMDSLRSAVGKISANFEKNLKNELGSLPFGGNMVGAILRAQQNSGADISGLNPEKFGVKVEKVKPMRDFSNIGLSEWQDIANAYFDLEDAKTTSDKILAIDRLNDLQHCGGNLLVDFQMGHRVGEGKDPKRIDNEEIQAAVDNLKDVLDLKRDSKSPKEYLPKMSSDVRKVWMENRRLLS